ncbi:MAG: polymerase sigma-54 factor [Candidatus Sumerlaeota bacterium]|nr:polymerase sigma-54 factor [Candidatus Sumerlaeota bacterium]
MALHLQQVLKQTQRLIMTPQMQQSIQLLQLNSMELEQMIHEEMMENPLLELVDDEENLQSERVEDGERTEEQVTVAEPESGLSDDARQETTPDDDFPDVETSPEFLEKAKQDDLDGAVAERPDDSAETGEFETFEKTDVDWGEEFSDSDTITYASTRETVEEHDFTTYTAIGVSLYDSLLRQARLSVLEGKDYEIAEFIIGNLNEDGLLDCGVENLTMMAGYPPDIVNIKGNKDSETRLRRAVMKIKGPEAREHVRELNHKQLVATVVGHALNVTPDEAMAMPRREWLLALIARKLERPVSEIAGMRPSELVLEVIALRMGVDSQRVFDVLEVIHDFEPTGVGARDLAECLRLQCEERGIRNRLLYTILDDHLPDLQQKRFREIARELECQEQDVVEVFQIVSKLDPRPGLSQSKDSARYIKPDVYVKKLDDHYMYFLNEGDAGRLRIASNYRRMINHDRKRTKAVPEGESGNGRSPDNAAYAHEKYKNAIWLIKNIEKRKSTVLRVTEAIMNYQMDFLEHGIEHLRPLTLRNIAEVVGMHESTIARVTTGKYVETPRGIFELKFFFSSGLETDDGEDASSRSIKEMLTQMINNEDLRKPLSDQKIADMLKDKGINIARRTVAKYREQLKILPAKLRKQVGN